MDFQRNARLPISQGEVITLNRPLGCTIKAIAGRLQIIKLRVLANVMWVDGHTFFVKNSNALVALVMSPACVSIAATYRASTAGGTVGCACAGGKV